MQGSNNGKIKMARQKLRFDDEHWSYSPNHNKGSHKKTKHKSNKPIHQDKVRMIQ